MFEMLTLSFVSGLLCYAALLIFGVVLNRFHSSSQKLVRPSLEGVHHIYSGAGVIFSGCYFGICLIVGFSSLSFVEEGTGFQYLIAPLLVMAVAGFLDDIFDFHWLPRLVFYSSVSFYFVFQTEPLVFHFDPKIVDTRLINGFLCALILLGLTNVYNFMDGIDGMAASEALFVLISSSCITYFYSDSPPSPFIFLLFGPLTAFLVLNFPRAKIYMGDSGSIFLGFFFGALILHQIDIPSWSWLILLSWFVGDGVSTLLVRLLRGQNLTVKHQTHAYQHLENVLGTFKTLGIVHSLNLFWLFPIAILSFKNPEHGSILFLLAVFPLSVFHLYCGAGQLKPKFSRET